MELHFHFSSMPQWRGYGQPEHVYQKRECERVDGICLVQDRAWLQASMNPPMNTGGFIKGRSVFFLAKQITNN